MSKYRIYNGQPYHYVHGQFWNSLCAECGERFMISIPSRAPRPTAFCGARCESAAARRQARGDVCCFECVAGNDGAVISRQNLRVVTVKAPAS
jgi:hypothetical protein